MLISLKKSILMNKDFIVGSVSRDIKSKWKSTQLGPVWLILQPLSLILVYTIIFSKLMRPGFPNQTSIYTYSIYLCSGLLPWVFFSELFSRNITLFIDYSHILKKVAISKITLPIILLFSCLINFIISLVIFLIFLLITNNFPGFVVLGIIPIILLQIFFTISLSFGLGVLNVFFRDIQQSMSIFLQFWFWLTPIIYLPENLPKAFLTFLSFNPLAPIFGAYQKIFVERALPDLTTLIMPLSVSAVLFCVSIFIFKKLKTDMLDEI